MAKSESTSLAFFFGGVARPEKVCDPFRTKTDSVVSAEQNFGRVLAEDIVDPFDDALLVLALLLAKPSFAACHFKCSDVVLDTWDLVDLAFRDCEVNLGWVRLASASWPVSSAASRQFCRSSRMIGSGVLRLLLVTGSVKPL